MTVNAPEEPVAGGRRDLARPTREQTPWDREELESGTRRNRYWAITFVVVVALLAAYFGFSWAERAAVLDGASAMAAHEAGLVVAVAALLATTAVGNALIVLTMRTFGGTRGAKLVLTLSAVLLVVAVVLFVWVYPMMLE